MADVLAGSWQEKASKPGRRMQRCAQDFLAAVNLKTATVKHCPLHCDVMLCPTCLSHRHRTTLKKARYCIGESAAEGDILRHIVLTAPRWHGDVREGAERLAWWYAKLTRRAAWRSHVRASMAVFECTGGGSAGWHWHVHVLTIGQWWQGQCKAPDGNPAHPSACSCKDETRNGRSNVADLRCLMQEWHQVTDGEARIVHISAGAAHHRDRDTQEARRLHHGGGDPIAEAVKYVVKTQELSDGALVDFQVGMRGFQRVRWGGEWFGVQPPEDEATPMVIVCPTDLWRLSTGTIGPLLAPLLHSRPDGSIGPAEQAALAAGWDVRPFNGPMPAMKPRPPPLVVITEDIAAVLVASLEQRTNEVDDQTTEHFRAHPSDATPFLVVPF